MNDFLENLSSDTTVLNDFHPATTDEIKKLIKSSSNASCDLDPIPTVLLKECCDEIAPVIADIVNCSLKQATIPNELKKAIIIVLPLLKKVTLDPEKYKNYRPVSNLSFVSKIIEKVVAKRTKDHLNANHLCEKMQSAYRCFHSMETALL